MSLLARRGMLLPHLLLRSALTIIRGPLCPACCATRRHTCAVADPSVIALDSTAVRAAPLITGLQLVVPAAQHSP
eukprot:2429045-Amphidinium_carterae.1